MNYSEVEAKVREATNDDAWGPHGGMMQEVAQYTFTYEHFPEVMGMLWKRMLHDNKKNWRRVYKVSVNNFNFFPLSEEFWRRQSQHDQIWCGVCVSSPTTFWTFQVSSF